MLEAAPNPGSSPTRMHLLRKLASSQQAIDQYNLEAEGHPAGLDFYREEVWVQGRS